MIHSTYFTAQHQSMIVRCRPAPYIHGLWISITAIVLCNIVWLNWIEVRRRTRKDISMYLFPSNLTKIILISSLDTTSKCILTIKQRLTENVTTFPRKVQELNVRNSIIPKNKRIAPVGFKVYFNLGNKRGISYWHTPIMFLHCLLDGLSIIACSDILEQQWCRRYSCKWVYPGLFP